MPIRLTVFPPHGPVLRRTFEEGRAYLIGRDPGADMALSDSKVSREHLRLVGDASGWRVQDLASKNGTRLDGRVIDAADIDQTAWLSIGGLPAFIEPIEEPAMKRDAAADRRRRRRLQSLRMHLEPHDDFSALLEGCLDGALELSACDRGSIWLLDAESRLKLELRRGASEPPESRSVLKSVLVEGKAVLAHDVAGVEALARRESILLGGVRALVCLPLKVAKTTRGLIYADSRTPGKFFTDLDIALLQGLADQAALALAAARVRGEISALGLTPPASAKAAGSNPALLRLLRRRFRSYSQIKH